jgi:hypothetical protein
MELVCGLKPEKSYFEEDIYQEESGKFTPALPFSYSQLF